MKNDLYNNALKDALSSPRLICVERNLSATGTIISNEINRFQIELLKKEKNKPLLSVGTTTSFDLAAHLCSSQLIIIDASDDVILAHEAFYRPLFLISKTASEFVANFLGYNSSISISESFKKYRNRALPEKNALEEISVKLSEQDLSKNLISFCLNIIKVRPSQNSIAPYNKAVLNDELMRTFCALYDPKVSKEASGVPWWLRCWQEISFLKDEKKYSVIRNIFLSNNVQYALGDIRSRTMMKTIAKGISDQVSINIYTSNVLEFTKRSSSWGIEDLKILLSDCFQDNPIQLFQTIGTKNPFQYKTILLHQ